MRFLKWVLQVLWIARVISNCLAKIDNSRKLYKTIRKKTNFFFFCQMIGRTLENIKMTGKIVGRRGRGRQRNYTKWSNMMVWRNVINIIDPNTRQQDMCRDISAGTVWQGTWWWWQSEKMYIAFLFLNCHVVAAHLWCFFKFCFS